ncbi:MgtC/SapB family protein [Ferrimonas balearica]|uniref:MgtC/SapB family protein n=1 Tax=Ferrimonas balearica TaxID=44012 RepID=UPI001C99C2BC|nr:MgtC/SapB family protein [Ferrimonas balearica]MBY5991228.1 MgtC/SapB family protein [Ferrimonas balearica]
MNAWWSIAPFDWVDVGAALLCGFLVGLERQLRGKPVGIRTSTLIVLGTHLFIVAAGTLNSEMTDGSRIIGQVVTGVGFLGAGVMLAKDGIVVGVTSAAAIWALAGIGVCLSVVGPGVAVKLSLVVVAILYGVDALEHTSTRLTRGVHNRYYELKRRMRGEALGGE